ncbi:hypothetical protein [Spirillospora sp. NPDC047279]|uniref:hypothetical protein n=1 Tax=Spirillospora sp. NPDC047279 TaxID=3155478 RepID=UPI0033E5F7A2
MQNGAGFGHQTVHIELMTSIGVSETDAAEAREVLGTIMEETAVRVAHAQMTLAMLAGHAVSKPALVSMRVYFDGHTIDTCAAARSMRDAIGQAGEELRISLRHEASKAGI